MFVATFRGALSSHVLLLFLRDCHMVWMLFLPPPSFPVFLLLPVSGAATLTEQSDLYAWRRREVKERRKAKIVCFVSGKEKKRLALDTCPLYVQKCKMAEKISPVPLYPLYKRPMTAESGSLNSGTFWHTFHSKEKEETGE